MKRRANPQLTPTGEEAVTQYEQTLQNREDLTPASIRNYLSDLRHFLAWYETCLVAGSDEALSHRAFDLQTITTPALTRYRAYLQKDQRQKPASVNRALISLKRYFDWAMQNHLITYDPSATVKLVRQDQVKLGKRSGFLEVIGKRNKYREVPLNTTARKVLEEYLSSIHTESIFLFPSGKTKKALTERMLGYIVKKYARLAKLTDVSPHDLRHRFGYRMAESVPLHRLAQIMGHDSLDTTKLYIQGTRHDLQQAVETIAWR